METSTIGCTRISGTHIIIVARLVRENTTGSGVARIDSARVVIVAGNRWESTLASRGIAIFVRAHVVVLAGDVGVGAAGSGETRVNGAR